MYVLICTTNVYIFTCEEGDEKKLKKKHKHKKKLTMINIEHIIINKKMS